MLCADCIDIRPVNLYGGFFGWIWFFAHLLGGPLSWFFALLKIWGGRVMTCCSGDSRHERNVHIGAFLLYEETEKIGYCYIPMSRLCS